MNDLHVDMGVDWTRPGPQDLNSSDEIRGEVSRELEASPGWAGCWLLLPHYLGVLVPAGGPVTTVERKTNGIMGVHLGPAALKTNPPAFHSLSFRATYSSTS